MPSEKPKNQRNSLSYSPGSCAVYLQIPSDPLRVGPKKKIEGVHIALEKQRREEIYEEGEEQGRQEAMECGVQQHAVRPVGAGVFRERS